jgi:hypothetical protein
MNKRLKTGVTITWNGKQKEKRDEKRNEIE